MAKHPYSMRWTTEDELKFLKGLGGWVDPTAQKKITDDSRRIRLLKSYGRSTKARKNWGSIEVGPILEYIETELKIESLTRAIGQS